MRRKEVIQRGFLFLKIDNTYICLCTDQSNPTEIEKNNDAGEKGEKFGSEL